jgi:type IV pilus assembly protein PilA
MRKYKGFSLIELLIVVVIAIPNLLRARMSANESAAASSIRTINTAQVSYVTAYPTTGYAALSALGGSATACTTPDNTDVLATNGSGKGKGGGYNFAATTSGANNTLYVATADPVTVGSTGQRSFCSVEDAVIRFDSSGTKPADHGACQALGALN